MKSIGLLIVIGVLVLLVSILLVRVICLENRIRKKIDFQRKFNRNLMKAIWNLE